MNGINRMPRIVTLHVAKIDALNENEYYDFKLRE